MDKEVRTISELSSEERRNLRRRLLNWFRKHKRDLPWRKNRNPYAVWVSEIMLQQTQVATVEAYFKRFMKKFPAVQHLAAAEESAVLRMWEGLGYYRRARQMHAAANMIVDEFRGEFPTEHSQILKLPGIGRYTAGAIASIALGQSAPIVEANTARLYARLIGFDGVLTTSAGQGLLWQTAEDLLPRGDAGTINQALMELGSLVCTPSMPNCPECPLKQCCNAFETSRQHVIPKKNVRPKVTALREAAVIVVRQGRVLLRKCGKDERWAGLWDFPRFSWDGPEVTKRPAKPEQIRSLAANNKNGSTKPSKQKLFLWDEESAIEEQVHALTGIVVRPISLVKSMSHAVTRYKITLDCFFAEFVEGKPVSTKESEVKWVSKTKLEEYPLSTSGRKMANLLDKWPERPQV